MKKINRTILYFILTVFLYSCSGISDVGKTLSNEKTRTTDEFLVKKREPLVLPPNYEEIPKPGTISKKKENDEEKIKKILKAPKTQDSLKSKSSSIEESILIKIRK